MVKNGDLNFKLFSHKYFISSLEYISMIVYTNVENQLFLSVNTSIITDLMYIVCQVLCVHRMQQLCMM